MVFVLRKDEYHVIYNRIFFFCFENGTYVLLHQYRKKTQKTPKREIKKAKQERKEYLQMKEKENENME